MIESPDPLTKTYDKNEAGEPKKVKEAGLSSGTARRVVFPIETAADELARLLGNLKQTEVLVAGQLAGDADVITIKTEKELERRPDPSARHRGTGRYSRWYSRSPT